MGVGPKEAVLPQPDTVKMSLKNQLRFDFEPHLLSLAKPLRDRFGAQLLRRKKQLLKSSLRLFLERGF